MEKEEKKKVGFDDITQYLKTIEVDANTFNAKLRKDDPKFDDLSRQFEEQNDDSLPFIGYFILQKRFGGHMAQLSWDTVSGPYLIRAEQWYLSYKVTVRLLHGKLIASKIISQTSDTAEFIEFWITKSKQPKKKRE